MNTYCIRLTNHWLIKRESNSHPSINSSLHIYIKILWIPWIRTHCPIEGTGGSITISWWPEHNRKVRGRTLNEIWYIVTKLTICHNTLSVEGQAGGRLVGWTEVLLLEGGVELLGGGAELLVGDIELLVGGVELLDGIPWVELLGAVMGIKIIVCYRNH